MKAWDTDDVILGRDLRQRLNDLLVDSGSCRVVDDPDVHSIEVELRRHRGAAYLAIPRAAWALAHPEDHLTPDEVAIHSCENTGANGTKMCANPAHLVKGSKKDRARARDLRAKGFFKEERYLEAA